MATNGKDAYHGSVAINYDKDRMSEPLWNTEQDFIKSYVAEMKSNAVVLDIPVGTGRFIDYFLNKGLSVVGMDISTDMLAIARNKYANASKKCSFVCGNAEKINFPDNSFDYIICWRLTHLISPKSLRTILKEFSRLARKEIVIQFFNIQKGKANKSSLMNKYKNIVLSLFNKTKQISVKNKDDKTPWGHIRNYLHYEDDFLKAVNVNGFHIKLSKDIEDHQYQVKVYVLTKN